MNGQPSWKNSVSRSRRALLMLALLAASSWIVASARADDGPTVIKDSVHINVFQNMGYWAPGAKDADFTVTSWFPRVEFRVRGPIPGGSQFSVEFTKPDGSPWTRVDYPTDEIKAGETFHSVAPEPSRPEGEKKYSKAIGVYGFKIHCKNELVGQDQVIFTGKFKVGKVDASLGIPKFKNKFNFYVDHDWALPLGYVGFSQDTTTLITAHLMFWTWIKGDPNLTNMAAYVFYNGKQVASTKDEGVGTAVEYEVEINTVPGDKGDPTWKLWSFQWGIVATNPKPDEALPAGYYALDKNPGEYEVKVLRAGKLCRSAKFTVDSDGKVVDNGIAAANQLGTDRVVIPVQVLGADDGAWNKAAWKTDAFYGNPLQGFTAP